MLILLVEDNSHLATNIIEYLEFEGVECDWARRGDHGLTLASQQAFDAIVLDLNLPYLDGMSICKLLREKGVNTPVIMLTARSALENKLEGFNVGADDYLVKPFDLPELHARILSIAKRKTITEKKLVVDDLELDVNLRKVSRAGSLLQLNRIQWIILVKLMQSSPNIVTREELEFEIWQEDKPNSDALKMHLHNLRTIVDKPFGSKLIHTLRGVGVVLRQEQD